MDDTLDTLIVICEEATEPRDLWRNRFEFGPLLQELKRARERSISDERALAVCSAALEQGELAVVKSEQEASQ